MGKVYRGLRYKPSRDEADEQAYANEGAFLDLDAPIKERAARQAGRNK